MSKLEECCLSEVLKDREHQWHHRAHCMIWAPWNGLALRQFPTKAAILMQIRFDGSFGFPGGIVDEAVHDHQDIVKGLGRELAEEINLNDQKFKVTTDHHLFSHMSLVGENASCYSFYAYRVDMDEIRAIERDALAASDYGDEVFGLVRVPLYTMENGVHGFPNFLKNVFVNNAKEQLLKGIKMKGILTEEEIQSAVKASQ